MNEHNEIIQPGQPIGNVALVASYVPRKCGIATFTHDLRTALSHSGSVANSLVIAMDDSPEGYPYPHEVAFQVQAQRPQDYQTAAELLNINKIDVTIVQHEYGIFGGPDGSHILALLSHLRMPVITTLHTVLATPTRGQLKVLKELGKRSDRLVVMSQLAGKILNDVYGVPDEKVVFIPHGIPDVPFVDPAFYKDQFGLEGRTVLLTFGLLSPGKGIEVALRALPDIVASHPDVVYVVLGATHPHVIKHQGSAYRVSLEKLANELGMREHVVFHNRFVTLEELCGYIGASDLYLTPYRDKAQITSGTLAYAMGAGKAAISTPYWYAEEMIGTDRGRLFDFDDHEALTRHVKELLGNDMERNAIRKRAYMHGRSMVWTNVAHAYTELATSIVKEYQNRPRPVTAQYRRNGSIKGMPDIDMNHLVTLTDSTGILQHAIYSIPDRDHGYCTDDNARALIATLYHHDLTKEKSGISLINTYLAFLHHAFDSNTNRFRNFMSYDRKWLDETASQDSHGRALWALGVATSLAPNDSILSFATRLFSHALSGTEDLDSPRAIAYSLIGIHAYLRHFDGDTVARRMRNTLADRLHQRFLDFGTPDWPWSEEILTYDNAKLPHALVLSGQWIPNATMTETGLRALEWLVSIHIGPDNRVRLIGNRGWMEKNGGRANFDQQPIDASALVEACAEAYRCTQDSVWLERARTCFDWFLGNNDGRVVLYDYQTGGSHDGLTPSGPNLNQGAESTLAWLIALLTMLDLARPVASDTASEPAAEKAYN
ncbi:MAG: hypothetical protein AMXMBFR84_46550 [Candidatus Hydrogenedentota bacterium]